ncbi:dethiobiotin synthase [Candidatus Regiella insecticola 5.15]|uniref:ATP-dependent dethiobiotin synthetase BioD n=1 Tax=Candidatus Regiella insecticola 5.15 TaxID=1005043 RepID=G2GYQ4_9ENTR|nr:dethiobiotin synthase [Candidatus Regiella insecticola]EGY29132.1 dethiobiotin synthase [Candidatus Regiella insecticola 5.15]
MTKRWFITGTDTNVGKTIVSCALLQAAKLAGYQSVGYKPVASGSLMTSVGIRNPDGLALQANSCNKALDYQQINPFAFIEATSPHIASAATNQKIELSALSQGLQQLEKKENWLVIEGAGGWFTPLSDNTTFADWVEQEKLPVILVVGIKLGCINHALLTAMAIQHARLPLAGWVANNILPVESQWHKEYMATLQRLLLPSPLLGSIPYLEQIEQQELGGYMNIELL